MVITTSPLRGYREDEEPVDDQDLLEDARLAFGFRTWAELEEFLEIPKGNIYQYTMARNRRTFNRKYIKKLAARLIEKLTEESGMYEQRIEALERELYGEGVCRKCPLNHLSRPSRNQREGRT